MTRPRLAEACMARNEVESVDRRLWGGGGGGLELRDPLPHAGASELDRFLGVRDLHLAVGDNWPLALMGMLTDPVLGLK